MKEIRIYREVCLKDILKIDMFMLKSTVTKKDTYTSFKAFTSNSTGCFFEMPHTKIKICRDVPINQKELMFAYNKYVYIGTLKNKDIFVKESLISDNYDITMGEKKLVFDGYDVKSIKSVKSNKTQCNLSYIELYNMLVKTLIENYAIQFELELEYVCCNVINGDIYYKLTNSTPNYKVVGCSLRIKFNISDSIQGHVINNLTNKIEGVFYGIFGDHICHYALCDKNVVRFNLRKQIGSGYTLSNTQANLNFIEKL